jgi:hypothetical protein
MRKFEIIEEGRLSKSDMSAIVGGVLFCDPIYTVETKCEFDGQPSKRSLCPGTYISCSCEEVSCAADVKYIGPPGPEGNTTNSSGSNIASVIDPLTRPL